jgi:hypothetical protein
MVHLNAVVKLPKRFGDIQIVPAGLAHGHRIDPAFVTLLRPAPFLQTGLLDAPQQQQEAKDQCQGVPQEISAKF